jgi:hypothetical protein
MSARIALAGALTLLSCAETDGSPSLDLVPVPSTPPTLQVDVGTGTSDFVERADGDPVELVYGSQGGYHVWTAIRVHDERVPDVQVNLSTRLMDGTPAGPASRMVAVLSPPRDGARSAAGLRNFIENAELVRGQRFVLRVEVVSGDQQHGFAERVVTGKTK